MRSSQIKANVIAKHRCRFLIIFELLISFQIYNFLAYRSLNRGYGV